MTRTCNYFSVSYEAKSEIFAWIYYWFKIIRPRNVVVPMKTIVVVVFIQRPEISRHKQTLDSKHPALRRERKGPHPYTTPPSHA